MIKIDRFLGQFSEVLCTALHQWVEVSYVTKWFHHQENIFYLRIITMIWPNHKNHNYNFLDSSLIAVPFEKRTAHMFNDFPMTTFFRNSPRSGAISSDSWLHDHMSQLNSKVPAFCGDMWSFPGGFLLVCFGWCFTDDKKKGMESHENLHITIGRQFNVSPAKKHHVLIVLTCVNYGSTLKLLIQVNSSRG